jgi:hypothetical protein
MWHSDRQSKCYHLITEMWSKAHIVILHKLLHKQDTGMSSHKGQQTYMQFTAQ